MSLRQIIGKVPFRGNRKLPGDANHHYRVLISPHRSDKRLHSQSSVWGFWIQPSLHLSKTGWLFWSCRRRAARGWPQPLTVRFSSFSSKAGRPQGKLRAAFMRPQQPHTYFNLNYSPGFSADAGNYLCLLASWQPALSSEVSQIDLHVFHSPPLRETNPGRVSCWDGGRDGIWHEL